MRFLKHKIYRWAVGWAVCLLLSAAGLAQDLGAKVDEYIQAHLKMNRFSGAVLMARDGQVLISKGYGMANREYDIPNTPQTKFRLGSVTKQFTATAILQLQEKGKLSVQDPLCKYFPECPEAWQEVTLHHLLTHTSGVPSYTDGPDYRKMMVMPVTVPEMIGRFKDKPLEFKPGEKFKYSNSGYFLLGYIIEKASGKSYEQFLRESIFDAIGMKDSGYDHYATILPRRAEGYTLGSGGVVKAPYLDMGQPYSAGSLYSTVEDLYRWDQALYTEKLLSKKSFDAMFTPFKNDYAYGWAVASQSNRKTISHGGGINGFSTHLARYPDDRACVIVLSNLDSAQSSRIGRDLTAILFGEKYEVPKERQEAKVDPKLYDAYVGRFELRPDFVITVSKENDRLVAQAANQPKIEIFPESETKFFLKVMDAQITFVKNEKGEVTHLVLHQGGRDQQAKKVP